MPKIIEDIILNCSIKEAFNKMQKLDYEKAVNPQQY
jgi:hypothetical protein